MAHKLGFLFLISGAVIALNSSTQVGQALSITDYDQNVLGATTVYEAKTDKKTEEKLLNVQPKAQLQAHLQINTVTAFDQKIIQEYEPIPYDTKFQDNSEMLYGTEEVLQQGLNGTTTYDYLLTYWIDDVIDKQLMKTSIEKPTPQVVDVGTKIVWNLHSTPDVGRVKYWHKMRVWATKYDANCIGCTGRTFSGTEVKKGVCAVDPNVIPLGTNFYVDRYGLCRAEDIGGAIKGDKIDLGFVDASKGNWGAEYTDIYLLTNAPE